jgi:putative drug exporter of the RND superfamily
MSPKAQNKETTRPADRSSGLFPRLGGVIVRWPWAVVVFWVALVGFLAVTVPSLEEVSQRRPVSILPDDAPSNVTNDHMTAAFHEEGISSISVAVLTDEKGLSPADEDTYRKVVDNLRRDTRDVQMLQDFISAPPLRDIFTSKDHKAWLLPIGLPGDLGTKESKLANIKVGQIVRDSVRGTTLKANVTGPAATVGDLNVVGQRDRARIEFAIIILLFVILLLIYRNPVTMALPLIAIGVSLLGAQKAVAIVGLLGLPIANQTIIFMSGMLVGVGTDYAVFLISRYHDYIRAGEDNGAAVVKSLTSIGKVIAASAATVAVTFMGMIFTRLGILQTVGPVLGIAVATAFLVSITLLPALLVITGSRGWIAPRRDLTRRLWRRSGVHIVRRPKVHLLASLLVLVILASCAGFAHYDYDDRKTLPPNVESSMGYATLDKHFPTNLIIPEYLLIESPHDLRTSQGLADLEEMARRISQVPGVASVRGITRPMGEPLEQARATWQAGQVGDKLSEGSKLIGDRSGDLDKLAGGANLMAGELSKVRDQVNGALATAGGLIDALAFLQNTFGGSKTLGDLEGAAKLVGSMRSLGDMIGANANFVQHNSEWATPVLNALNTSPACSLDPGCVNGRNELQRMVTARDDGSLGKITQLAQQLQATQALQTLAATVDGLRRALSTVMSSLGALGLNGPGGMQGQVNSVRNGANQLADGSRQLADGVQLLVDQVKSMGGGLNAASAFLLGMKDNANSPSMSGFYIPPQLLAYATGAPTAGMPSLPGMDEMLKGLNPDDIKKLAGAFISPDGHSVRYLVQTKYNPFTTAAMDQVDTMTATARGAQPNTTLADAKVSLGGLPAMLKDTSDYSNHDLRYIIVMTIFVVLLILMVLLRAVVAPLYLIASVIISYLSALGIGVVFFQFLLGREMHWSVPGLTFIILVAVGADYNMLLISRIRDESPNGVRAGIIRTVTSTGGVITAAGLIMAASMFGLLFSSLANVVQGAFVLGVGLLLDTFVVRTITVPAMAAMIGRANWWPSKPGGAALGAAAMWPPRWRRDRRPQRSRKPLLPDAEREPKVTADHLVAFSMYDGLRL